MVERVSDYNNVPRNVVVVGFFFYEHATQPHKQIFFKRQKLSITTQVAAEGSETIFYDAQIITVMSAVQLTKLPRLVRLQLTLE